MTRSGRCVEISTGIAGVETTYMKLKEHRRYFVADLYRPYSRKTILCASKTQRGPLSIFTSNDPLFDAGGGPTVKLRPLTDHIERKYGYPDKPPPVSQFESTAEYAAQGSTAGDEGRRYLAFAMRTASPLAGDTQHSARFSTTQNTRTFRPAHNESAGRCTSKRRDLFDSPVSRVKSHYITATRQ